MLDAIAQRTGSAPSPGFTYNWAFATAHVFLRELRPIPYLLAAVEELQRRGHRMAVASQSPLARVRFSLDVAGLAAFFGDRIFVTSMVPRPKPAPDVYLLAAERLGAAPRRLRRGRGLARWRRCGGGRRHAFHSVCRPPSPLRCSDPVKSFA